MEVGGVLGFDDARVVRDVLGSPHDFLQWDGDELSGPADQVLTTVGSSLSRQHGEFEAGPRSFAQTPVFLDGTEHERLRRLLDRAWRGRHREPRVLDELRADATRLVTDPERRKGDLVRTIASPFACAVLGRFFGLSPDLFGRLAAHSPVLFGTDEELGAEAVSAAQDGIWLAMTSGARGATHSGALAAMSAARLPDGEAMRRPEILTITVQMGLVSNRLLTALLAATIAEVLAPDPAATWRSRAPDAEQISARSLMRAPIRGVFRRAGQPTSVAGKRIRAGAGVYLSLSDSVHPSPALAFGHGRHVCPGRGLSLAAASVLAGALTPLRTSGVVAETEGSWPELEILPMSPPLHLTT